MTECPRHRGFALLIAPNREFYLNLNLFPEGTTCQLFLLA